MRVCGPRAQIGDVYRLVQGRLGHHHRLVHAAADTDPQHTGRAPAGAHLRHALHNPIGHAGRRVEHRELRLVLGSAALGRNGDMNLAARDHLGLDHGGRIVTAVLAAVQRVDHDRCAKRVRLERPRLAHRIVDHLLKRTRPIRLRLHPDLDKGIHGAGILANRAMPGRAHPRIDEDLRNGGPGRGALLARVGARHGRDEVWRMVVRDVLQRIRDAGDQIRLGDAPAHAACPVRAMIWRARAITGASIIAPATSTAAPASAAFSTALAHATSSAEGAKPRRAAASCAG